MRTLRILSLVLVLAAISLNLWESLRHLHQLRKMTDAMNRARSVMLEQGKVIEMQNRTIQRLKLRCPDPTPDPPNAEGE